MSHGPSPSIAGIAPREYRRLSTGHCGPTVALARRCLNAICANERVEPGDISLTQAHRELVTKVPG